MERRRSRLTRCELEGRCNGDGFRDVDAPSRLEFAKMACTKMPATCGRSVSRPLFRRRNGRNAKVQTCASLAVKEKATGVEYPLVEYVAGAEQRCLGAGARSKKIAFVGVHVYAVALYVDPAPAAKELGLRQRGGFFEEDASDSMADALLDGAFNKGLHIVMVRKLDGKTFGDAIVEALTPRLFGADKEAIQAISNLFDGKELLKGTEIIVGWRVEGQLEFYVRQGNGKVVQAAKEGMVPDLVLEQGAISRALFSVYLGSDPISADAKSSYVEGGFELLESEIVKRSTRKGGSG